MKTKYFITAISCFIFLLLGSRIYAQENYVEINKLNELLRSGYKIIDVRTPEEYATDHIPGAIEINFLAPNFALELDKLNKQDNYIVYDNNGTRSQKAAKLMTDKGFISVYYLMGGYDEWKSEKQPVEKNQNDYQF